MSSLSDIIVTISILFPVIAGVILLLVRGNFFRGLVVTVSSLFLIAFSVSVAMNTPFVSSFNDPTVHNIETAIMVGDFLLLAVLLYITVKHKRWLPAALVLLQAIPLGYFEFFIRKPNASAENNIPLFVGDHLSLVMMFLILIIGSLIAIFAVRYMKDYEHHNNIEKSRQPFFFFVIFIFLGAMSGLVLSNNLLNMYFFWEMTTLCSFLLISFSKTDEAVNNAFRALWMNLIGGVAFIFAIILFYNQIHTVLIDEILSYRGIYENVGGVLKPMLPMLPLALLAIAAFTKAAQFPFQSWLLGAMVAPTPVSALLHSSTMVKAGVYLLVRFSPAFMGTKLGYAVAIIGGFTFLAASALAIGQSNAKRVLAYSTIANLGLIAATAGIGTPVAITAAILLIIFHAVSKGLLFLCVGTIEHAIGSRDIENMDGLISKMPLVGSLTAIGMFSMLLPPFGVVITKLLGIEVAATFPVVLLFIVLGSALTVVFWAKWMGKILTISNVKEQRLEVYSPYTVFPLSALAILVVVVSVGIIPINRMLIEPYIASNWTYPVSVNFGTMLLIPIFIAVLCVMLLIPIFMRRTRPESYRKPYMCGENVEDGPGFTGPIETVTKAVSGNYYLEQFFKEKELTILANIFALAFISFMFGVIL